MITVYNCICLNLTGMICLNLTLNLADMYACLMTKKSRIRSEMKFTLVLLIFYDVLILGIEMLFIFTEFVCLK